MFSLSTILLFLTLFTTSILSAPLPFPVPSNGNNVGIIGTFHGNHGIGITEQVHGSGHHKRSPGELSPTNTDDPETTLISDEEDLEKRDPEASDVGVKGKPDFPFGLSRAVEEKRNPEPSNVGVKGKPNFPFGSSHFVSGKREANAEAYDPVAIEGDADFPFGLTEDK
jgi:hypothetical protein